MIGIDVDFDGGTTASGGVVNGLDAGDGAGGGGDGDDPAALGDRFAAGDAAIASVLRVSAEERDVVARGEGEREEAAVCGWSGRDRRGGIDGHRDRVQGVKGGG